MPEYAQVLCQHSEQMLAAQGHKKAMCDAQDWLELCVCAGCIMWQWQSMQRGLHLCPVEPHGGVGRTAHRLKMSRSCPCPRHAHGCHQSTTRCRQASCCKRCSGRLPYRQSGCSQRTSHTREAHPASAGFSLSDLKLELEVDRHPVARCS